VARELIVALTSFDGTHALLTDNPAEVVPALQTFLGSMAKRAKAVTCAF